MLQRLFSQDQWALVFFFDSIRFIISLLSLLERKHRFNILIHVFSFSTVYVKAHAMLNQLFTRMLAKTCILM